MNSKTKEALKKILRNSKLVDKYERLICQKTTVKLTNWYNNCDDLYAISRVRPYIEQESDISKFLKTDKEWVELVVRSQKCAELFPYVHKYGFDLVVKAIHYLMDNALWESPKGNQNIYSKADIYKGLVDIDEAVVFLKDTTEQEVVEETVEKVVESTAEELVEEPVEIDINTLTKELEKSDIHKQTRNAFTNCLEMFKTLSEGFKTIHQYFNEDDFVNEIISENYKLLEDNEVLKQEIINIKERHQRALNNSKCQAATVTAQYKNALKEIESLKQANFDVTSEKNKIQKDLSTLVEQHRMMKDEYLDLKAEVEKLSKSKTSITIPMEKFAERPLLGPKTMAVVYAVLTAYGITIKGYEDKRK